MPNEQVSEANPESRTTLTAAGLLASIRNAMASLNAPTPPLSPSLPRPFGGVPMGAMPIVVNPLLTERVQHSRSPSRARRRARRGFPQHYIMRPMKDALKMPDGSLVMHPATYEAFKQMVRSR